MPNKLFTQRVLGITIGTIVLIIGIVILSFGILGNDKVNNAQKNNSSKGHHKVKNDKCKQISKNNTSVGLDGLFCNANTPSTWQNDQDFAKNFYPKDLDGNPNLYKNNKIPGPFYTIASKYGERERQVESAQLLGQFQGQMQGGIVLGIIMILFGGTFILMGISSKSRSSK